LVIVSTLIALIFGVPLGIFAQVTTDVIIRPILDLMQTMPAFVYLIPAIFFFSVGNTQEL
jgi:glycine betaine/proline transport system permease protein